MTDRKIAWSLRFSRESARIAKQLIREKSSGSAIFTGYSVFLIHLIINSINWED